MAGENTANTSILISLESIQQQIQHCENIVDNIDKLVPNLYKIRQQALAQKNYIADIQHALTNNNKQFKLSADFPYKTKIHVKTESEALPGGAKKILEGTNIPTVLVVSTPSTNVYDTSGNAMGTAIKYKNKAGVDITKNIILDEHRLRDVIQSLYKFKHDQGTAVHFTTQQIDGSANGDIRKKGLNLSDVESITEGLNDYLSISDKVGDIDSDAEKKIKDTVLKLFAPVESVDANLLTAYSIDDSANIDSIWNDVLKAPYTSTSGDVKKELTFARDVKSKRKVFSENNGDTPSVSDYKKIITFGLN